MSPVIVVENLCKQFETPHGLVTAVNDVSFTVDHGSLFGLFGSNGAGKSTIVRILTTLLLPTSGRATVNGYDVAGEELQVRSSIGLVTADERSFYGRLTARENLAFYATLQNIPRQTIPHRVEEVLNLFGLTQHAAKRFQSLSTGQKQRLNMARALLHDPTVLFLDEPTKSMDVQTSDFVKTLIKDELAARQRKTIVFISHELYEMDNFCDQVVVLSEGTVQASGSPQQLAQQIPRRAAYHLEIEGDADAIVQRWRQLPLVESVAQLSQGVMLTTFLVVLHEEKSAVWFDLLRQIEICGGRLESYQRVDDGSLRQIVKHFSEQRHERSSQV